MHHLAYHVTAVSIEHKLPTTQESLGLMQHITQPEEAVHATSVL
jgi:hypothetical protein